LVCAIAIGLKRLRKKNILRIFIYINSGCEYIQIKMYFRKIKMGLKCFFVIIKKRGKFLNLPRFVFWNLNNFL